MADEPIFHWDQEEPQGRLFDPNRPGDQYQGASGDPTANALGTVTQAFSALGLLKDATENYKNLLDDVVKTEGNINIVVKERAGLYETINDHLSKQKALLAGFQATGGLPPGTSAPQVLPGAAALPDDFADKIGEKMKEAITPLLALEGFSLLRGGGGGGGTEGGRGMGLGTAGFLGSILGENMKGQGVISRLRSVSHNPQAGLTGILGGILHNPIMAARVALPELAPIFAGYEAVNLLKSQFYGTRQLGQITGQGFGAGLGARIEQFSLGNSFGGLNPFTPISGAVAASIIRGVREAGFSDSIAHALDNSVANVVANVGLPVDTTIKFFSDAMRDGGESMAVVSKELQSFGRNAHAAGESITDYTQRVSDLAGAFRAGGAGAGATALAGTLTNIFSQAQGFSQGQAQQLNALLSGQNLTNLAMQGGAHGGRYLNPLTATPQQMMSNAMRTMDYWIDQSLRMNGGNQQQAANWLARIGVLPGIDAATAMNLIQRRQQQPGFLQQYLLTGPGGLTSKLASRLKTRELQMLGGPGGLLQLANLQSTSGYNIFSDLNDHEQIRPRVMAIVKSMKEQDYYKAYTQIQSLNKDIFRNKDLVGGLQYLTYPGDPEIVRAFYKRHGGAHKYKSEGYWYTGAPEFDIFGGSVYGKDRQRSGDIFLQQQMRWMADEAIKRHLLTQKEYSALSKQIEKDPRTNLFSVAQHLDTLIQNSNKKEVLLSAAGGQYSIRIYLDKDGKLSMDGSKLPGSGARNTQFGNQSSADYSSNRANYPAPTGGRNP